MSLVGFKGRNHPQQLGIRGPLDPVDDRGTSPEDFAEWNSRWNFTIDVAAAHHNAKCARYFTIDDDGLSRSWAGETVWCNPPYSDIGSWVEKAWREAAGTNGIVMLLPANRTEQQWWQRHVEGRRDTADSPLSVEFLARRRRFIKPGNTEIGPNERPPFGVCLLIWSPS